MKKELLFKNGIIVTGGCKTYGDLLISGGKVKAIGRDLECSGNDCHTIDVNDCFIFPGAIDVHTHFSLPMAGTVSNDDFYNGSLAALKGGVTSFLDFAASSGGSLVNGIEGRLKEASEAVCDYSFHVTVTGRDFQDFMENFDGILERYGMTSVKLFTAYKSRGMYCNDYQVLKILEKARDAGGATVCVHAENADITEGLTSDLADDGDTGMKFFSQSRPVIAEIEAVSRFARMVEFTGSKGYVVHVSSGEASMILEKARERGVDICGETSANYLLLNSSIYLGKDGHHYATCPPLRSSWDNDILWSQLGVSILAAGTDHCPFNAKQKNVSKHDFTQLPFGLGSIELNIPLLFSEGVMAEKISLETFSRLTSEDPARIFGLYPRKGNLLPGADADLYVVDPGSRWTVRKRDFAMKTDISPFEGREIAGSIRYTVSHGEIVFQDGQPLTGLKKGRGKLLKRKL